MDWKMLQEKMPKMQGTSERSTRLANLQRVLMGCQYDHLEHAFSQEKTGANDREYVPLNRRRPSVKTNLCRVVVDDSVSLLFSEGHWPRVLKGGKEDETTKGLLKLIKQTGLNAIMIDAATRGSVGSSGVLFRIVSGKPFFEVLDTIYLTPLWQREDPTQLDRVTERYKVKRETLEDAGYENLQPNVREFWHKRVWTTQEEVWYVPQPVGDTGTQTVDAERSLSHQLGFVPIAWAKNLPGGSGPDGGCTYEAAIDTVIEIDYLLSQGGRALKYASDPQLVLIGSVESEEGDAVGGASSTLELPPEADAKLLEINGHASNALLAHVRELRSIALEAMHGNRTHADRLNVANSGRAIEMMMTGLIWVADRLRISYGEGQLLNLLKMVCRASQVFGGLEVDGESWTGDAEDLGLVWRPYILPSQQELLPIAQALVTAKDGGIISARTAADRFGGLVDVEDPDAEFAGIEADQAELLAAEIAQQAAATRTRNAGNSAKTRTRKTTA